MLTLIVQLVGCVSQNLTADHLSTRPSDIVVSEIRNEVINNSAHQITVDPTAITIGVNRPSDVVSGLTYFYAVYHDTSFSHAIWRTSFGIMNGDTVGLRSFGDWQRLVGRWVPADSSQVLTACLEVLSFILQPEYTVLRGLSQLDSLPVVGRDLASFARLSAPEYHVKPPLAGRWLLWTLGTRESVRYACAIGSSDQSEYVLIPIDSLVGVGVVDPLRR